MLGGLTLSFAMHLVNILALFVQSSEFGIVTNGFNVRLANRPFLVLFLLSGTLVLRVERQSAGKSKN